MATINFNTAKFEKQIIAISEILDCKFVLKGEPISAEKVFSVKGLLPGIMRRADQLCSFCMGYGLGLNFERSEESMLEITVEFDDSTPNALRLMCIADVIIEMMQQSPNIDQISVDSLLNE